MWTLFPGHKSSVGAASTALCVDVHSPSLVLWFYFSVVLRYQLPDFIPMTEMLRMDATCVTRVGLNSKYALMLRAALRVVLQ